MPKTSTNKDSASITSQQWSAYFRVRTAIKKYLYTQNPNETAYNEEVNKIGGELKLTKNQMSGPMSMAFNDIAGDIASSESMQKFSESMFGSEDVNARIKEMGDSLNRGMSTVPNLISNLGSGSVAISKMTAAARDINAVKKSLQRQSQSGTITSDRVKSDLAKAINAVTYSGEEIKECCKTERMKVYAEKIKAHVSKFYSNRPADENDVHQPKEGCLKMLRDVAFARGKIFSTVSLEDVCTLSKRISIPIASASIHNSVINQEINRIYDTSNPRLDVRYSGRVIEKIEQMGNMFDRISKLQSSKDSKTSTLLAKNDSDTAERIILEMNSMLQEIKRMPSAEIKMGMFPSFIEMCEKYISRYKNFSIDVSHGVKNADLVINSPYLLDSAIFQKLNKTFQSEVNELGAISASGEYPVSKSGLSAKSVELKNAFIMELSVSHQIVTSEIAKISQARDAYDALKDEMIRLGRDNLRKTDISDPQRLNAICRSLDAATKCAQSCSPKLNSDMLKSENADEIITRHTSRMLHCTDLRNNDKGYDILKGELNAQIEKVVKNKFLSTEISEFDNVPNIGEYGFSDEICDACNVVKKYSEQRSPLGENKKLKEHGDFEAIRLEYLSRFASNSKNGNTIQNGEMDNIISSVSNLEKIDLSTKNQSSVLQNISDFVSCLTKQAIDTEIANELITESSKIASSSFKNNMLLEKEITESTPELAVTQEGRLLIATCINDSFGDKKKAVDAILQNLFFSPEAQTVDGIVERYKADDASGAVLRDILCEFVYARIIASKHKKIKESELRMEAAEREMIEYSSSKNKSESINQDLINAYNSERETMQDLVGDLGKECYQNKMSKMSPSAVMSAKYRVGSFPAFDSKFNDLSSTVNREKVSKSIRKMMLAAKVMSGADYERFRVEQAYIIQSHDLIMNISESLRSQRSQIIDPNHRLKFDQIMDSIDGALKKYQSPTLFNDMYSQSDHMERLNYCAMFSTEASFFATQFVELFDGIVGVALSQPFRASLGVLAAEQTAIINSPGVKSFIASANPAAVSAVKSVIQGNSAAFVKYLQTLNPAQQYKTLKAMQSIVGFAWRHNLAQLISKGKGPLMGVSKTFLVVGSVGLIANLAFLGLSIYQAKIEADFKRSMIDSMCAQGEKISALQIRVGEIDKRINRLSDEIESKNIVKTRYIRRCEEFDLPFVAGESSVEFLNRAKSRDVTSDFSSQIIESSSQMVQCFAKAQSENSDTVSEMCNKLLCSPSEVSNRVIDMRGIISSGIVPKLENPLNANEEDVRSGQVIINGEFAGVKDNDPRFATKMRIPFSDSARKPVNLALDYLAKMRSDERYALVRIEEFTNAYNEFLLEQYSYSENLNNMISICKLIHQYEDLSNKEADSMSIDRFNRFDIGSDSDENIMHLNKSVVSGINVNDSKVSLEDISKQKTLCRAKIALLMKKIAPICQIKDFASDYAIITPQSAKNLKDWASKATKDLQTKAQNLKSSIASLNDLGYCVTTPYITASRSGGTEISAEQKVAIANSDAVTEQKLSKRDVEDAFKPNIFVKKGKLDAVMMPFSSPDKSVRMVVNISKVRAIGTQNLKEEAEKEQRKRDDKVQKAIAERKISASWVGEAIKPRSISMVR